MHLDQRSAVLKAAAAAVALPWMKTLDWALGHLEE
jgi:hypothetical protein